LLGGLVRGINTVEDVWISLNGREGGLTLADGGHDICEGCGCLGCHRTIRELLDANLSRGFNDGIGLESEARIDRDSARAV
jgi:hypothetical protein